MSFSILLFRGIFPFQETSKIYRIQTKLRILGKDQKNQLLFNQDRRSRFSLHQ